MSATSLPLSGNPGSTGPAVTEPAAYTEPADYTEPAAYTRALRETPLAVNPPGWVADWAAAPWQVAVHAGGRRIPLPGGGAPGSGTPRQRLGRLLFRGFAVSRVRLDPHGGLPATPQRPLSRTSSARPVLRRPIPSGGSMYPAEVYLLAGTALQYDPYRHELIDLARPIRQAEVLAAAGFPAGTPQPAAVLVLSNRVERNYYKYGEFAFRLGAVDLGVALGRALRLAHAEFGTVAVRTGFDDAAVHAALGSGPGEYAVAVLAVGVAAHGVALPAADAPVSVPAPVRRGRSVVRSARFESMLAAALRPAPPAERAPGFPGADRPVTVRLPAARPVSLLTEDALLRRTSNGSLFDGRHIGADALAAVLVETVAALAAAPLGVPVQLCCAVHAVDGVPPGWYHYRPARHALVAIGDGGSAGSAALVQRSLHAATLNAELAGCTVHVVATDDYPGSDTGTRGYRVQQLAVGLAIEAITLAAAATGLGNHPLLGFDAVPVDAAYGLAGTGWATHAQVCLGSVREQFQWEVPVLPPVTCR